MMSPKSEADVVEVIRAARAALAIRGGGTRAIGAAVGEVLETGGLTGISLYEPGALTIVAQAGTPLAEIEAALAAEGQALPFEPPLMGPVLGRAGVSTIGGVVAANASGPRRIQAGACRDALIGVRFVDGRGAVLKNGGRVMKNVTGYDLVKLMAGSYGTLGVLTEVAFKVLPRAQAQATLVLSGLDVAGAIQAMTAGLRAPFEVNAAAYVAGETWLRIEGFEASVVYRAAQLCALLAPFGAAEVRREGADWAGVRDLRVFEGGAGDLWRISVKPSDGARVVAALAGAKVMLDWGGGLVWAEVSGGRDVRADLRGIAGHATLVRASAESRARLGSFHPEAAPVAAIGAQLRAQFDPKGLLNPGLMEAV